MEDCKELLKTLTEAHGVSGYEAPVRGVVRTYLEPLGELSQDKLGSVICRKQGESQGPRIMVAGHMDEIGFMVKNITEDGFIYFLQLGGWYDQVLLGQRVIIKGEKGDVIGVIGAKPPHLLPADEREKVVKKKDMFIDIGATSKEEVQEAGVRTGDVVVPRADFVALRDERVFMSKAFDDRVGVALIISALQELQGSSHPNTVYGVSTVMEEVGLRGATTSVRAIDPDVAIILESDIAGDIPGIKPEQSQVKMGAGPSLLVYDVRMIPNLKLRDMVRSVAEELEIPLQLSFIEGGATDGAAIHLHDTGVPTVVLGVPARHIHSDSSMLCREDYENTVRLLVALLQRLDQQTVEGLTQ